MALLVGWEVWGGWAAGRPDRPPSLAQLPYGGQKTRHGYPAARCLGCGNYQFRVAGLACCWPPFDAKRLNVRIRGVCCGNSKFRGLCCHSGEWVSPNEPACPQKLQTIVFSFFA